MTCEEIMNRNVHTVIDSDSLQTAARRMRENNVGFLPVCDHAGKAIGVLTDRDIVIRGVAENKPPALCTAGEVMSRDLVTCWPTDDITRAEDFMARQHKSRILIVDDFDQVRGVISLSDIAKRESARRAAAIMRQVASREVAP